MKNTETLLIGVALGAGLAYFLDQDRGRRRRAGVRDQLVHAGHELEDATRSSARHVRNRAIGVAHEARAELLEGEEVEDRVLEERVRSEIGRSISGPSRFEVAADHGRVTLSGEVAPQELQEVVRSAKSVRGVEAVDNRLRVRSRSEDDSRSTASQESSRGSSELRD